MIINESRESSFDAGTYAVDKKVETNPMTEVCLGRAGIQTDLKAQTLVQRMGFQ